jgi:hypothetical protein
MGVSETLLTFPLMSRFTQILNYLFFSFPLLLVFSGLFGALRKLPINYSGFFTRRLGVLIFVLGILVFYALLRMAPSISPLLTFMFSADPHYGAYGY